MPSYAPSSVQLGHAIAASRRHQRISQSELARRAGMDRAYLNHLEHGRRNPTLDLMSRVCAALEMRLSALIADAESVPEW